jgi:uncharacterized membrane protein
MRPVGCRKVIIVVLAIVVVVATSLLLFMLLRTGDAAPVRHRHLTRDDHALDVAREQLSAGVIDADQYERIVIALRR